MRDDSKTSGASPSGTCATPVNDPAPGGPSSSTPVQAASAGRLSKQALSYLIGALKKPDGGRDQR